MFIMILSINNLTFSRSLEVVTSLTVLIFLHIHCNEILLHARYPRQKYGMVYKKGASVDVCAGYL